jgi:hypothetical protein
MRSIAAGEQHEPLRCIDAVGALHVHHHARGCLVVREGVRVDVGIGAQIRVRARWRLDDQRRFEMRGSRGGGRELGRELAEAQVLAAPLDQPEHGRVPEHRRAAHAEDDFVRVGEAEQLCDAGADAPHDRLHASTPVARAEVRRGGCRESSDGVVADLRRPRPEAAIGRQQFGRELDVAHEFQGSGRPDPCSVPYGACRGWLIRISVLSYGYVHDD